MIIVFDLDDTLYDEIDFVKSGFKAVAQYISPKDSTDVFKDLFELFLKDGSGRVFNQYQDKSQFSFSIEKCVELYRFHTPNIELSEDVQIVLQSLTKTFSLGLLTDGPHQMQKNKFVALNLQPYFEYVVFSDEFGLQKPAPELFDLFTKNFSSEQQFMYIADNPKKDFISPNKMGWKTIRYKNPHGIYRAFKSDAHYEITELKQCLSIINDLVN